MECCILHWIEHAILAIVLTAALRIFFREGFQGLFRGIITALRVIPGVNSLLSAVILSESKSAMKQLLPAMASDDDKDRPVYKIPATGEDAEKVLAEMKMIKDKEVQSDQGKLFGYVYTTDKMKHYKNVKKAFKMFSNKTGVTDEHLAACVDEAYTMFSHENALNPTAFPSLRQFETETISMVASMLHGDAKTVGALTSGGTESILMAMKTYRDRARKFAPHIKEPEVVAAITIHPAFEKAAAYFNIKMVHVPVDKDYKCDIGAVAKAITKNTILIAVSAPQYPHGILDPVIEAAELARARGLPLHVDACFGGFMLPWVEKLGYPIDPWDFRVDGVTSISADLHKYGWGVKGTSCLLFKNKELRSHMIYTYPNWPGGLFASPSMAGTRPGGVIAAAWAALKMIGEDGYLTVAKDVMETTLKLMRGVEGIDGIEYIGKPCMTAFAIRSTDKKIDILAVADVMETRGWKMERQQYPSCLHFSIMPHHVRSADDLIKDLNECVQHVKSNPKLSNAGTAAMYGMVANIPDKTLIDEFLKNVMSEMYTTAPQQES